MVDIGRVRAGRRGIATDDLRRHNLSAVLNRLHLYGPMSRSDLARVTGLNRSTIRDLISELVDVGLVVESRGTPTTGPGRPSSVAEVAPGGAVVLAVEIEVDSITVATIGMGGCIFNEQHEPIEMGHASPDEVVSRMVSMALPLMADLPEDSTLVGVGVAVAGVVRRSDGFIHVAPNMGWRDVPIAQMIRSTMGFDLVRVANEADMGALAELRRGAAIGSQDMIFVTGEIGVGIGIIHGGSPMLGTSGYAGEAGHMQVNPNGMACRCGSTGCWETEVGEEAVSRHVNLDPDLHGAAIDEVVSRAGEGDQETLTGLWEVGRWLGVGIGNLINILNPETVVVGGSFQKLYPFIAPAVEAGAREVSLDPPWEACVIAGSRLGDDAVIMGVAELVLGEVVADPMAHVSHLTSTV